jgi:hypothetical protein
MKMLTFEEFVEEALKIVNATQEHNLTVRLMGALAVYIHCPKYRHLLGKMQRVPTDIDVAAYSKDKSLLTKFLKELGYKTDERLMSFPAYAEGNRYVYYGKTRLDVFFDELKMCHRIDWRKRLNVDYPTIPIADIALEKLQIVKINPKDIKDLIVLFLEHDIGNADHEMVNGKYIAETLAKDWGFCYTVTMNLKKTLDLSGEYISLSNEEQEILKERITTLLNMIEQEPKSLGWKMRSQIGTKKKWYMDVEDDRISIKVE